MKSTFRVLFFLKRDKVKKNGNMPIMARITIDGKLAQFNTKLEVNPKNWQAKTGKVSGRGAEFTRMNEMLDGIKATLYKHYQTILERDGYVTAEKVRNTFLGKEEKAKTLLQVFAQHNARTGKLSFPVRGRLGIRCPRAVTGSYSECQNTAFTYDKPGTLLGNDGR